MYRSTLIPLLSVCGLAASALAQPCGTPWSQSPSAGPSARRHHAMAYDSARGKVVLFGGLSGSTNVGDTWEWTATDLNGGGSWQLRSTTGPSPRDHCGLAYDSVRQKTVLFGGLTSPGSNNETWEWDGASWTQVQPLNSPPAMDASLMAYDPARQRVVLVGTPQLGATWEYDGAMWSVQAGSAPQIAPGYSSIAYDAARSRLVATALTFGSAYTTSIGVFERAATTWSFAEIGTYNLTSTGASAAYDPVRGRVVFVDNQAYGGQTTVWVWNGTTRTWTVVASGGPPPAEGRACVYDVAGAQLLIFGGRPPGGSDLNQTWLFRSDSRHGPTITNPGRRSMFLPLGGSSGTMSVAATGSGTLTYQWRLNGVDLFDGGSFSGVHTPTLTVNPNDVVYAGDYDALVTDSCGTTFRPATRLTVNCYANCTGGTAVPVLTAEDFQCFLNAYATGCLDPLNCYANCDRSTATPFLNVNDFQCFFNQYAIGCH